MKEDRPLTIVVRPRINFDVPFELSRRLYTRTNVGDLTVQFVKCGGETRIVVSNIGDDIVKNACPAQSAVTEIITRDEREALSAVVQYLAKNPYTAVEIEGQADWHGSGEDAFRFGIQLASIIKEYLSSAGKDRPDQEARKPWQEENAQRGGNGRLRRLEPTCRHQNSSSATQLAHGPLARAQNNGQSVSLTPGITFERSDQGLKDVYRDVVVRRIDEFNRTRFDRLILCPYRYENPRILP